MQPEEPASFMKPASCMFRPGGEIVLPPKEVSNDVDAEGELGVIIGRAVQISVARRYAERDFRVHDDARFNRAGRAREESPVFDAGEKHRHVFHVRSGDRDGGRGRGYRVAGSDHGA